MRDVFPTRASNPEWSVGDRFQFQVSVPTCEGILLARDRTSSNTGPRQ
jgi:hypothetical protein